MTNTSKEVSEAKAESYSFKEDQEKFYREFKTELCKRLQPVIENLTNYLRVLETKEAGSGKAEVEKMLKAGEINQPMYEVLMPGLENLDKEYKVNLEESKYFKM